MLLSKRNLMVLIWLLAPVPLITLSNKAEGETAEPRGEIRVVESWRPDINVLGHNVLQYLFEYALDKNGWPHVLVFRGSGLMTRP